MYVQTATKVLLKIKTAQIFCQKIGWGQKDWLIFTNDGIFSTPSETAF